MSTETTVQNLKINKVTKAQYDTITKSSTEAYEITDLGSVLDGKQSTLVSGTNIKTINNESLLGSGNITIQGGGSITVDQTYDSTSANAQSGVAIAGAGFLQVKGTITASTNLNTLAEGIYTIDSVINSGFPDASQAFYGILIQFGSTYKPQLLVSGMASVGGLYHRRYLTGSSSFTGWVRCGNAATGSNAFSMGGTPSTATSGTNIGIASKASGGFGTAIGYNANGGSRATALGWNAIASGADSIQIGNGTNSSATTLSVGFYQQGNYQLLDGTTGKIPDDRLNTTIVRKTELATVATSGSYADLSNKPTIPTVNNATLTITQGGTTKGTFTANASSDVTIALDAGGGGSNRNIGEIVASTVPLTDAGLHLLDGALIQRASYSDFVDYIASIYDASSNYFCSESDWQTSVTNYGVCGKFVYDSTNNTVRLPKITGIIEGTTDLTALGDLVEAGLPNITGTWQGSKNTEGAASAAFSGAVTSGQFGASYKYAAMSSSSSNDSKKILDASLSSSIYGNSSTVQPQTIKVLYYVVIATSTKTSIQVDIDEIATDLNGKADTDLLNVPNSKGILSESYVNGASWYRIYSDGWCEQGGLSEKGTIYLTQQYVNANYTCIAVCTNQTGTMGTNSDTGAYVNNKTTSSFYASIGHQYNNTCQIAWYTCGYIR